MAATTTGIHIPRSGSPNVLRGTIRITLQCAGPVLTKPQCTWARLPVCQDSLRIKPPTAKRVWGGSYPGLRQKNAAPPHPRKCTIIYCCYILTYSCRASREDGRVLGFCLRIPPPPLFFFFNSSSPSGTGHAHLLGFLAISVFEMGNTWTWSGQNRGLSFLQSSHNIGIKSGMHQL